MIIDSAKGFISLRSSPPPPPLPLVIIIIGGQFFPAVRARVVLRQPRQGA